MTQGRKSELVSLCELSALLKTGLLYHSEAQCCLFYIEKKIEWGTGE